MSLLIHCATALRNWAWNEISVSINDSEILIAARRGFFFNGYMINTGMGRSGVTPSHHLIASTRPSSMLRTQPDRLRLVAARCVSARKKTPCTLPLI
jgi:hypothetical protein